MKVYGNLNGPEEEEEDGSEMDDGMQSGEEGSLIDNLDDEDEDV